MSGASDEGIFRLRTVMWLLAVGVVGFVGMLVVGAYAPDLKTGRNGGAHALSNAAVGYSGIVRLAEATGRHPRITRDPRQFSGNNLLVLTPESGTVDVTAPIAARANRPTLMVLPKWNTSADPQHGGWVRYDAPWPAFVPEGVLAPATRLSIRRLRSGGRPLLPSTDLPAGLAFRAPRPLQVIVGATPNVQKTEYGSRTTGTIHPLLTDSAGHAVLVRIDNTPLYVLSDPDLLSNLGMTDAEGARSMLTLLDWLRRATPDVAPGSRHPDGIDFDVTLNGFGRSRSPLKLAFEPPFLAMTLAIAAALLLAGLHAAGRFGAARPPGRAIAFGTATLVDNAAALIRKAGRQGRMGGRYADVIRERARIRFGLPARVQGPAVDAALDRIGSRRFTDLVAAAGQAEDAAGVLAAAQALNDWQGRRA